MIIYFFFFQAEDGIRDRSPSRGLGDVYKRQGNGGYATSNNIENAVVCFKVEKSLIQDKKIDKSSITLNRYGDGKWNPLSTKPSGENDACLYFTAKTQGFSPFAITGKAKEKEAVTELQTKPNIQGIEQN